MAATLYEDKSAFLNRTITVTTTEELTSAIRSLSRGDGGTILVDGSADPFILHAQNVGRSGAPVLIKPLDEDVRPHIEQVNILNSSHLTITGMDIDSARISASRPSWESDVNVRLSNDIAIVGNNMDSIADGYRDSYQSDVKVGARGAMLRDSENITFSHNKVSDYRDGIIYLEVKGLTLVGNEITGIQGDGMRGGGIQDVLIAGNYMHDFYGSVQTINHSDMIQIWGNNVDLVTRNVVIRDNILDAGNGAATQSILILNEHFNRTGYYDNIKIHDNVIHNALQQGIGVDHVKQLEVYNNTVLWNEHATTQTQVGANTTTIYPRLIIRDSPDAVIEGNITGRSIVNEVLLPGDENILLSFTNPLADNYVGKHFVNVSGEGDTDLRDLAYVDDSPFKGEYGARLTSDPYHDSGAIALDQGDSGAFAVIRMTDLPGARDGVQVSAELSTLDQGKLSDGDITLRWTFSDGTVAEGLAVQHVFTNAGGPHDVTLEIIRGDTVLDSLNRKADTKVEELLDLDFNAGGADITSFDSRIDILDSNNDAFVTARDGDKGFELNGGHRLDVDRGNTQFTKLETLDLQIGFKKDTVNTSGILVMLHKAFLLKVEDDGVLMFQIETSDGFFRVRSEKGVIGDTNWHDINVVYDSPAGTLSLHVDDAQVGSVSASGITKAGTGFDLVIGALFSESVHGIVDKFSLSAPTSKLYDTPMDPVTPDPDPVIVDEPEPDAPIDVVEEEPASEPDEVVVVPVVVEAPVVVVAPVVVTPPVVIEAPKVTITPDPVSYAPVVIEDTATPTENITELLDLLERFALLLDGDPLPDNTAPANQQDGLSGMDDFMKNPDAVDDTGDTSGAPDQSSATAFPKASIDGGLPSIEEFFSF